METISIREKLHRYIDTIEEKRVQAIYTLFEEEIEQDEWEYTDEFKSELNKRYENYKNGGKMVSATEAEKQIGEILQSGKGK